MSVNVGSAVGYLDLDINGFLKGLKSAQSEAANATKSITKTISDGFIGAGKVMESSGKTLSKYLTAPIVGAGTAITKYSSEFEAEMSKVAGLSGATGKELKALEDKAKEMGASTKYSASEAAQGLQYMALAGWDSEQMLAGIEPVLKLAGAAEMDLGRASDIVTDALTGMGLQAEDAAHFTDVLTTTMTKSNTDVAQMGEAFKYTTSLAGTFGYSIEDIGLALGTMANAGIKAEQGGTTLRRMLMNMSSPTQECQEAMDALNISMFNSDGSARPLRDVLGDLRGAMANLTEEQQAQYATAIGGANAMSGLLAIVNASPDAWDDLASAVDNAAGSTEQMYATMQDNFKGQLTILKSSFEGVAIAFGEVLLPKLKEVVSKVQELANWLNGLSVEQRERIARIAAIVAAAGPLLLVLGKITTGVGNLISAGSKVVGALPKIQGAFSTIGTAIGGISAPALIVVGIIAALAGAFITLWKNNEEFRDKITEIWNTIVENVKEFVEGVKQRLEPFKGFFSDLVDLIKMLWQGFCDFLAPIFEAVFEHVGNILKSAFDLLLGLFDIFVGIWTGDWETFWNGIKEFFGAIWNAIKSTFEAVWNIIKGILTTVLGWFGTTWKEQWTNIKDVFTAIWNKIKSFFTDTLNGVWNKFKSWASDMINKAKSAASDIYNKIVDGLKNLPSKIKSIGSNLISGLWEGITGKVSWLYDKVAGFASGLVDKIRSKFQINSPSRVMRNMIGRYLPPGIGQGFEDEMPNLVKTIGKSLDTGMNKVKKGLKPIKIDSEISTTIDDFGSSTFGRSVKGMLSIDYEALAFYLGAALKNVPITTNVSVEMQDGDVYFDNERVGRKVAPVVSRVLTQDS